MSLKILHLPLIIFLVMAISCISSGQDSKPNLIICGIWQTPETEETNQIYADALNAEYVHTYNKGNKVDDLLAVEDATPSRAYPLLSIPLEQSATAGGPVYRSVKDPSTGATVWNVYTATELNGLTDQRLNPSKDGVGDHYGTIYVHSGGARTAVTALLYQGVTADKLVLISPAKGLMTDAEYNMELQRLLESGIVKEIVVYQSSLDTPFAGKGTDINIWQGKFKPGDVTGNFRIEPVDETLLDGKTGEERHIQMWIAALSKDSPEVVHKVLEQQKQQNLQNLLKPGIPKSLLKKEFLASLTNPLLSPYSTSDMLSGESNEGPGVSETGKSKADMYVWWVDWYAGLIPEGTYAPGHPGVPPCPEYFIPSGDFNPEHNAPRVQNTWGYDWIYLPASQTGPLRYSQLYFEVVEAYLASFEGSSVAGVGPLDDEGQNGGGGW